MVFHSKKVRENDIEPVFRNLRSNFIDQKSNLRRRARTWDPFFAIVAAYPDELGTAIDALRRLEDLS